MDHFKSLERMYLSAPINEFFRPRIEVSEASATIRMIVRPDMHHAARAAHGAVYFKMLDDAAFFSVQSLFTEEFVLTTSFNIHLLAPVPDGEMVAVGRVTYRGKRTCLAEATLDVGGRTVAVGTGSFVRGTSKLDTCLGYIAPG